MSQSPFEEILAKYKERLYWHIRGMIYLHEDASDILQETFIKIYLHQHKYKGGSQIYTWAYRIATNEALQFLRKKAKNQRISIEELETNYLDNLHSDTYFSGDSAYIELQKALQKLPTQQKTIFKMRYFQELKFSEIAEILECSEGNAKSGYHHAKKKIQNFLIED